ncbi:small GTP-binding protein domain protein [Vittaforma corneae ATCC 50505]|uniref:Small GTP-binding protein domain protein n=1 Tax=Vittaforma corneae (strain ATCC 50505) TaxID=993615 RepID=L2GQ10_VITCO|nr:small GTP-binding protein domain protein [Vittaforma corneae ATCC 50505]ELA42412.1 small GTP-binding protein domain protein [Vittaforma corneae ATCC 50505]
MDKSAQYIFKIILIGDSGVGKTSLMTRFTDKSYKPSSSATIGVDFKIKTIDLNGTKVKLQIWDTAGQERFRAVVSNYYRGAHGIFVVFDMLNKTSFDHLSEWLAELEKKNATNTAEIMVLGNKVDDQENVCINEEEITSFLDKNNIPKSHFVQVSARENIRVEESFLELTRKLS